MASPSTPQHGKLGALYRLRPNGFKGNGLNDLTFGTGYSGADAAYYEIEIDSELGGGGVDTFKWRKDGGAYTEDVDITGAAQTLDEGQEITFAATTGHTLADRWVIGNLKAEATTEVGAEAQITESTRRILNPNAPPTFTDDGGEPVLRIDYVRGSALFAANVGTVTVEGNNGYIPSIALEKVGYIFDWNFDVSVDLTEVSKMQDKWKSYLVSLAGGTGGANAYFIGVDSFFDSLSDQIDGTQDLHFLQLFNYDPDDDQTGDHFDLWVLFNGLNVNAPIGEVVKEGVSFTINGAPNFVSNA